MWIRFGKYFFFLVKMSELYLVSCILTFFFSFRYVTIASVCMATYRSNHIQPNTIAMVPVHGYINRTNFSPDSIRWLDFVASSEGVHIQHALNGAGERKITGVSVDGYCAETKTIYQYQVTLILFTMIYLLFCYFFVFNDSCFFLIGLFFPWMWYVLQWRRDTSVEECDNGDTQTADGGQRSEATRPWV